MTDDELREAIERPGQTASLWGQEYSVTPRLSARVFGDGQLLVKLQPLNTRPERYLVRVDSSVWGDGVGFDDNMGELYDDLLDALEDEYGRRDDDDACEEAWPRVDNSAGTGWGCWGSRDEVVSQLSQAGATMQEVGDE